MNDEDVAARLAEAFPGGYRDHDRDELAAALLPVVREIADQRAAEELRALAHEIRRTTTLGHIAERAERRAAALRGEAGR